MAIYSLNALVIFMAGCASAPPLSGFEKALFTDEPYKATVVIYRSAGEGRVHRVIPAYLYVDNKPFIKLLGREYVQIYLAAGKHEVRVEYSRDCELATHEAIQAIISEPGRAQYLEIVPGFGGMAWLFCSPFQLVPFPGIGSTIEITPQSETAAHGSMGKAINEELAVPRQFGAE